MDNTIPLLTPNDVELRVSQIQQTSYGTYVTLLCYKDARCDMRILDSVYGPMNWQRSHEMIGGNLFCTISIWDKEKQQWISKQDVGVESNTEATKGQASDAEKRAAFNWGIGRELYNAPNIRFKLIENEVFVGSNGKPKTFAKFRVSQMNYDKESGEFIEFVVVDENNVTRFEIDKNSSCRHSRHPATAAQTYSNQTLSTSERDSVIRCCLCNAPIKSEKVIDFAIKRFGKALCYDCQKKANQGGERV